MKSRQMIAFWDIYCFKERSEPKKQPPLGVSYARWAAVCKFFENNRECLPQH